MSTRHDPAGLPCPDCSQTPAGPSRRDFIRSAAVTVAATTSGIIPAAARAAAPQPRSETLCQQLFSSLTEKQRSTICMPWDHKLRGWVDNNWHITKTQLTTFFNKDQQALVKEIFLGLHSEQWGPKVLQQVEHDGGFGKSSVAFFGEPGTGKFQFVLTGRHCTRRCDGDSVEGAAFGGPIFYGHAAESFNEGPDHKGNIYWPQALKANEVFAALDGKQRKLALVQDTGREENATDTVLLGQKPMGIPCSDLSADQKQLVQNTLNDLLAMFRPEDVAETMKLVSANGGVDSIHMSFYAKQDIGGDGVWDVWQLEGPAMVWYFRGKPHVHTWVHVRDKA